MEANRLADPVMPYAQASDGFQACAVQKVETESLTPFQGQIAHLDLEDKGV